MVSRHAIAGDVEKAKKWAILTGEYPPQQGGVSDYTKLVAESLVASGDEVHVWCPPTHKATPPGSAVQVHRLPDHFGLRGLSLLDAALARLPRDTRVLVQYVPHAFGNKGMNLAFCLWLASWRRQEIWVMFHEVAFPLAWGQPVKHNILGAVNRVMACLLRLAADRTFVSTSAWACFLGRVGTAPVELLPVPSNLPTEVEPREVAAARARLAPTPRSVLLGHFGTFGALIAPMLACVLPTLLLADRTRTVVLIGRHSRDFARRLQEEHPGLAGQVVATGEILPSEAAVCLAACDLLLQPYPDGATTRRTTLMSGLALGCPVVSTTGHLTESFWPESGAVTLTPTSEPEQFLEQVELLLANDELRSDLGRKGRLLYRQHFSIQRVIEILRGRATATTAQRSILVL